MPSSSVQRARHAAKMMIRTASEAESAAARIQDLSGCPEGTSEENELIALVFALEVWEAKAHWRGSAPAQSD
jgi:phage tail tape-measure protein